MGFRLVPESVTLIPESLELRNGPYFVSILKVLDLKANFVILVQGRRMWQYVIYGDR